MPTGAVGIYGSTPAECPFGRWVAWRSRPSHRSSCLAGRPGNRWAAAQAPRAVHPAFFQVPGAPECSFIQVTNLSSSREIEVTRLWFATEPRVDVLNQERWLAAQLRLDETFETWIPVSAVPAVRHLEPRSACGSQTARSSSPGSKAHPAPWLRGRAREPVGKVPGALVAPRPTRCRCCPSRLRFQADSYRVNGQVRVAAGGQVKVSIPQ